MPEISRFLGIVIAILYRDHQPPHFHETYGEFEISVGIEDGIAKGEFPRRALALVLEWYQLHQDQLRDNWELAMMRKPLRRIPPLE
jgi:hypothetical protein